MTTREEIAKKADASLAMLDTAGRLPTKVADRFIKDLVTQTTFLKRIRTVTMSGPEMDIPKLGIGNRVLRGAPADYNYMDAAKRVSVATSKVTLKSSKVMAVTYIPYDVLEDSIEREQLGDTIMGLVLQQASSDIEQIILYGDKAINPATDDLLCLFDGVFKRATSNVVDHTAAPLAMDIARFTEMVKAMPEIYLQFLNRMQHWVSPHAAIDWTTFLQGRVTGLGDANITKDFNSFPANGVPVAACANMQNTNMLLTDPKNVILGVQRDMTLERDKDIEGQFIKFVLTMRLDTNVENEAAVTTMKGLSVS